MSQACSCAAAKNTIMLYACSGAANVAEIADRVARRLTREGKGSMFCLAGLGAEVPGLVDTALKADLSVVLDGCPVDCSRKIVEKIGLKNTRIIRITDLGIEKAKGVPVSDEQVEKVYQETLRVIAAS